MMIIHRNTQEEQVVSEDLMVMTKVSVIIIWWWLRCGLQHEREAIIGRAWVIWINFYPSVMLQAPTWWSCQRPWLQIWGPGFQFRSGQSARSSHSCSSYLSDWSWRNLVKVNRGNQALYWVNGVSPTTSSSPKGHETCTPPPHGAIAYACNFIFTFKLQWLSFRHNIHQGPKTKKLVITG